MKWFEIEYWLHHWLVCVTFSKLPSLSAPPHHIFSRVYSLCSALMLRILVMNTFKTPFGMKMSPIQTHSRVSCQAEAITCFIRFPHACVCITFQTLSNLVFQPFLLVLLDYPDDMGCVWFLSLPSPSSTVLDKYLWCKWMNEQSLKCTSPNYGVLWASLAGNRLFSWHSCFVVHVTLSPVNL